VHRAINRLFGGMTSNFVGGLDTAGPQGQIVLRYENARKKKEKNQSGQK
jgi:hypothetical protein